MSYTFRSLAVGEQFVAIGVEIYRVMYDNKSAFSFLWGGAAVLFLRQKKKFACKGWQDCIGSGDILFLLLLTPVWCLRSFVIFLLAGAVVSLICNRVYFSLHTGQQGTIPLVGTLGLCYVFFVVTHFIQT